MGFVVAAAPYIATGTAAAGAAYSAYAQYQAGRYSQQVGQVNAELARRAAADATIRGNNEEAALRERNNRLMGAQRAAYAASGVDLASGTPLDVLSSSAGVGELEALTVRNNAAREAYGYTAQATQYEAEGRLAGYRGTTGAIGSLLSGIGTTASLAAMIPKTVPQDFGLDATLGWKTPGARPIDWFGMQPKTPKIPLLPRSGFRVAL
jgi:hypothetical protein